MFGAVRRSATPGRGSGTGVPPLIPDAPRPLPPTGSNCPHTIGPRGLSYSPPRPLPLQTLAGPSPRTLPSSREKRSPLASPWIIRRATPVQPVCKPTCNHPPFLHQWKEVPARTPAPAQELRPFAPRQLPNRSIADTRLRRRWLTPQAIAPMMLFKWQGHPRFIAHEAGRS